MRILLADDHVLFRDALSQFVHALQSQWTMIHASNLDETIAMAQNTPTPFDLVMLDYRMPGMHGLKGLAAFLDVCPGTRTAIISGVIEDNVVHQALQMGACAYFPKTMTGKTIIKAIELVLAGERFMPITASGSGLLPSYYDDTPDPAADTLERARIEKIKQSLTKREMEVLHHLAHGLSNKEIAAALGLQLSTIKLHVGGICRKLGAENRTKAALIAHQYGFVDPA